MTPTIRLMLVERMPEYLRASHTAAGNSGVYPGNGADRFLMDEDLALDLEDGDKEWTAILREATAADAERYETRTWIAS